VGHVLVAVNGMPVNGVTLDDGRDVRTTLEAPENYPINLKFSRPKMTTNEKIFLASMFILSGRKSIMFIFNPNTDQLFA